MGQFYLISTHNVCCIWLAICSVLLWSTPSAQSIRQRTICKSIDIRNNVVNFQKLKHCTIIEGSLQILLMDNSTPESFEKLSFPNLIEIRDYLLFYRVQGLQNIGSLFPNLTVIRGTNLFYNYALVINDMTSLKEIGLSNLSHILRGSVRLEKNPKLCYIDTIDWDIIARAGKDGHFIKGNQNLEDCHDVCLHNGNENLCPYSDEKQTSLCWNRYLCQKVCSHQCELKNRSCAQPTGCCHRECLGGCTGSEASDCIACRNVYYGYKCMESCPSAMFQYNSRCITKEECEALPSSKESSKVYYKAWKSTISVDNLARSGQCSLDCPHGYMAVGRHSCKKCEQSCPKVCRGMKVDNLAHAQQLRGCTVIDGSLTIQLSGAASNIYQELETFLGKIETVDGYVKIIHSLPLLSLNFLSNLTLIKGEELERNEYSIIVRGNDNLQELWDWSKRSKKLEIRRGKPFFHFNSQLCVDTIKETMDITGISSWSNIDISTTSNGNKGACERVNMKLKTEDIYSTSVVLSFKNFRKFHSEPRTILSYVISYREVERGQEVSLFEGRDACSDGYWKVNDIEIYSNDESANEHDRIKEIITDLTPDTSYAIHVRTSVIDWEKTSGFSKIVYFTTLPDKPTSPVDLVSAQASLDSIHLKWKPPHHPNGKVTHYSITWKEEPISKGEVWQRNFCEDLSITMNKKPKKKTKDVKIQRYENVTKQNNAACDCPKNKKLTEDDIKEQINFENYIHNAVYMKRASTNDDSRSKRSLIDKGSFQNALSTLSPAESPSLMTSLSSESPFSSPTESTVPEIEVYSDITTDTTFILKHLNHYTKYHVMVKACHNMDHITKKILCSIDSVIYPRTKPKSDADDIDLNSVQSRVDNHTSGLVHLLWKEPTEPNGIIDGYQVEYKRVDIENFKPITVCITQQKFKTDKGHALRGLQPGKYSVRLQAISMAAKGSWTKPKYFEIIEDKSGMETYVIVILVILSVLFVFFSLVGGACFYFKKKYNASMAASSLFTSVNPEYVSTFEAYIPDEWEVPRENVNLLHELGQGTFGMVYEGIAKDPVTGEEYKCAVKTVNKTSSVREFLKEASVMKTFICHHVVRLKGIVSIMQPTLVIMELMENGDLRNYLRSQRPDYAPVDKPKNALTVSNFIQMAAEIADGMEYLATSKFVHRDLAARNCMVAKDLTVKIGDFGMTRDIYETDYYRKGGKGMLPVRWMAPESLKDGVFTSHSDVWSYGIVLWEMVTLACQPYQGLANEQVLKYVIDGGIIETPINCDPKLYEIMSLCWQYNPKLRPTFSELVESLSFGTDENFKKVSFHYKAVQHNNSELEDDDELITPSTPLHDSSNSNGDAVLPSGSKRTSDSKYRVGLSKSNTNGNHSSNGYVPCDSTGSTYC